MTTPVPLGPGLGLAEPSQKQTIASGGGGRAGAGRGGVGLQLWQRVLGLCPSLGVAKGVSAWGRCAPQSISDSIGEQVGILVGKYFKPLCVAWSINQRGAGAIIAWPEELRDVG